MTAVTAFLGSCELKVLTQEVEQGHALVFEHDPIARAIHSQSNEKAHSIFPLENCVLWGRAISWRLPNGVSNVQSNCITRRTPLLQFRTRDEAFLFQVIQRMAGTAVRSQSFL
jgi:hypothetical protein